MAKFIYKMQNILDIKLKLEEVSKQEYSEAVNKLRIEEEKLRILKSRKNKYIEEYNLLILGRLDFLKIEETYNYIEIIKVKIHEQELVVNNHLEILENARIKLEKMMKERKTYEKLKENDFEIFLQEINDIEKKEIDELISYRQKRKLEEKGQ